MNILSNNWSNFFHLFFVICYLWLWLFCMHLVSDRIISLDVFFTLYCLYYFLTLIMTVSHELFSLQSLWKSLDLQRTINRMLIKTHIIKVLYVIDESTIKMTLIFCLICTFVQIKVKQWELPETSAISSFHNDIACLMKAIISSDTSSIFLSGPCIEILSLYNLTRISHK